MANRHGRFKNGTLTLKEFRERLRRLDGKSKDNFIRKELNTLGGYLLEETQKRTPVDTGLLRDEWKVGKVKKSGWYWYTRMENPVFYASYQEYGYHDRGGNWREGKHMAKLAIEVVKKKIPKEVSWGCADWLTNELFDRRPRQK